MLENGTHLPSLLPCRKCGYTYEHSFAFYSHANGLGSVGADWNSSSTIGWIAMKFGSHSCPLQDELYHFVYLLTFYPVPLSGPSNLGINTCKSNDPPICLGCILCVVQINKCKHVSMLTCSSKHHCVQASQSCKHGCRPSVLFVWHRLIIVRVIH